MKRPPPTRSLPSSHGAARCRKRGELDNIPALCDYADKLEKASIQTMEDGVMDKNLAAMSKLESKRPVDTETFLTEINSRLAKLMG